MEGEGPLKGTPVASRIAIASTDFVAADRIGVEAMGVNPNWVGYLGYCCDAGLGQYDPSLIDLRGGVQVSAVRRNTNCTRGSRGNWNGSAPCRRLDRARVSGDIILA